MAKAIDFTQRNVAIDILRALTMLLMIFVNDLWRIKGEPDWLGHAAGNQDFMGLADIVFPCFLFVVGMSIPFAIERRFSKGMSGVSTIGHILTRSFALLIMGVFIVNTESGVSPESGFTLPTFRILMVIAFLMIWNVYPKTDKPAIQNLFKALKVIGWIILIFLAIKYRSGDGGIFRTSWWGILGLIGWAYLFCAFVYVFTRDRLKYVIPVWAGLILWCILSSGLRDGGSILNLPRGNFLDSFIGLFHIGNGALPAFTMGGILLSLISTKYINAQNSKKILFVVLAVAGLLIAGLITHKFYIVSKIQATPPWIFYCSAIAVAMYALLTWLVDLGKASWFKVIEVAGTATLTCYLVPYVVYSLMSLLGLMRMPEVITTGFVGILNCIAFSFLIIGITWLLGKIHIKLKI